MSRGVIYVRVSSDEQVKGMSLDFQKQDCLAYAQKKGITIERVFAEEGESAKFADRPELIGLLEYCRKHRQLIDSMIVWKLDRLSRNQLDYYYLKRTLLDLGIAIHSATEPSMEDSTSIAGKVFETFSALQAELDNTVRSERTRRGMSAKVAAGIYPWQPPVGYLPQGAKKRGEKKTRPDDPDPVLFPIIQSGLRLYATGQYSQRDLCRLLDDKGLAAARGRKTHFQLVCRMLYGALDFYHGWLSNPWTGESFRGRHQAMIDDEEYWRIVAVRDGRGHLQPAKKRRDNPLFPLRRLILCADCGRFYTGSVSRGHGGAYAYYHCKSKDCPAYGKGIIKAKIETEFSRILARYQLSEAYLFRLKDAMASTLAEANREARGKLERLDRLLGELGQQKKRIFEMREDGSYTKDEFLERKNALESEMGRAQVERAETAGKEYDLEAIFDYALTFVRRFGTEWTRMPPEVWQRFHQLIFPEGIPYTRNNGFGTCKVGLIFGLVERFAADDSPLVTHWGVGWNLLGEELGKLAQLAKSFLAQLSDEFPIQG